MAEASLTKPSSIMGEHYKKMTGFADMRGQNYEIKMSALLYMRGNNSGRDFRLATNMAGAGALDDVIYQYTRKDIVIETCFIQLKHKTSTKVNMDSLISHKGDFALVKYFDSYLDIQNMFERDDRSSLFSGSFESCYFAICTNALLHQSVQTCYKASTVDTFISGDIKVEANLTEDCVTSCFTVLKHAEEDRKDVPNNKHEVMNRPISLNEEEAKNFLRRLKLFTAQPSEYQLDAIIKEELKIYGIKVDQLDMVFQMFYEAMKDWWEDKEGIILDQNSTILLQAQAKAMLPRLQTLTHQQVDNIKLDIRFTDSSLESLNHACAAQHSLLIVHSDESLKSTASKVLQVLETRNDCYIFLSTVFLQKEREAVMSGWRNGKIHLLVIVSEVTSTQEKENEICAELSQVLQDKKEKRIMLVSPSGGSFASQLKEKLGTDFLDIIDSFHMSQLDEQSINSILDKKVILQEEGTTVRSLLGDDLDVMLNELGTVLETIIASKSLIVGSRLKKSESYYVERTIECRRVARATIFADSDFAGRIKILDATLKDVDDLIPKEQQRIRKKFQEISEGLVFDARDSEASNHTLSYLHYLELKDGRLVWRKTKGDINFIKKHVDETVYEIVKDPQDRVVLLAAEPGMGKSTFTIHKAQQIKDAHPNCWVVNIILNNHSKLLGKSMNAEEFLVSAACDQMSALDKTLFRYCLNHSGNVVIMLDGVDEVAPKYIDQCCSLLTSLMETKVKQIWVTSRHSMRDTLEENLSILATTLRPFTEEDQKQFLLNFWQETKDASSTNRRSNEELKEFITELLELTRRSIKDHENRFTGIPLQTMMLAEVYLDYVIDKNKTLPLSIDILQLTETFVENKYKIYFEKTNTMTEEHPEYEDKLEEQREAFIEKHKMAALILLFDETEIRSLHSINIKKSEKFFTNITLGRDKTGIIDRIIDGKPAFLHRVFAEFFAALWFVLHYAYNTKFMRSHLFTATFGVILNMFNRLLARGMKLHNAVLNADLEETAFLLNSGADVNAKDKGGRSALHLAVIAGINNTLKNKRIVDMIELLMKHKARLDMEDDVLHYTAVQYADAGMLWAEMDMLLSHNPNIDITQFEKTKQNINNEEVLKSVIKHDYANVMSLLLDLGLPVDSMLQGDFVSYPILAHASQRGSAETVRVLINRVKTRATSSSSDVNTAVYGFLNARDVYDTNALIKASILGHVTVVNVLLKSFADDEDKKRYVNDINGHNNTALLVSANHGHCDVVNVLIGVGSDVTACDRWCKTGIIWASSRGHLTVVKALLASFTDERDKANYVNMCDEDNKSAVMHACVEGYQEVFDELASVPGSYVTAHDRLMLACRLGQKSEVEILLASFTENSERAEFVNSARYKQGTALVLSAEHGHHDIVDVLIQAGSDVTACNSVGVTALMQATMAEHVLVVKALLASFIDDKDKVQYVNMCDNTGWSALKWARNGGYHDIIKLLVEAGALWKQ